MSVQTPQRSGAMIERFIGRQPILDRREQTIGYEVLCRSSRDNLFPGGDGDRATADVIDQIINLGDLEDVCRGRQAFVNMTRDVLLQGRYTLLPPGRVVLELLEDVAADPEVVRACRKLKQRGYRLALDDVADVRQVLPLLDLADVVKVDCAVADATAQAELVEAAKRVGAAPLAEKVETREQFDGCVRRGFRWFQGYFFQKPEIVARMDLPPWVAAYMRFLAAVTQEEIDFTELENTLKGDVALSVKLLRYLNSDRFNLAEEVHSIRQALVLLGEKPLRQWAAVVGVTCMAENRPAQLVIDSLVRARCCELLAEPAGLADQRAELFLMGLLSLLDVLVQQPMDELLLDVPVSYAVRIALLGGTSPLAAPLNLVRSCERQDVAAIRQFAGAAAIDPVAATRAYRDALHWANGIFSSINP